MKNTMRILSFVILIKVVVIVLEQCSGEQTGTHDKAEADIYEHSDEGNEPEGIVMLTDGAINEFGIETASAGPGRLEQYIGLTGEIVINPNRLAHIFPRFPGIVKEVRKKIGDRVEKDEVLAVIESNESLALYEVRSLIDGSVIDMHLTSGEVVSDGSHAFVIADLRQVWANLSIYQKNLSDIRVRQKVYIIAPPDSFSVTGQISYISPTVSVQTRTATARVVIDNSGGHWRPGLFVNGKVITGKERVAVLVPQSAVTTFEDQPVVFVRHEERFESRIVETGRSNSTHIEILSGLKPGEIYVSTGAFTLKSELEKNSFGGHHH